MKMLCKNIDVSCFNKMSSNLSGVTELNLPILHCGRNEIFGLQVVLPSNNTSAAVGTFTH